MGGEFRIFKILNAGSTRDQVGEVFRVEAGYVSQVVNQVFNRFVACNLAQFQYRSTQLGATGEGSKVSSSSIVAVFFVLVVILVFVSLNAEFFSQDGLVVG